MKPFKSKPTINHISYLCIFVVTVLRWLNQNSRRHLYRRPATEHQWTLVPVINSNNSESHGGSVVQRLVLWPCLLGAGGCSLWVLDVLSARLLSSYLTGGRSATLKWPEVGMWVWKCFDEPANCPRCTPPPEGSPPPDLPRPHDKFQITAAHDYSTLLSPVSLGLIGFWLAAPEHASITNNTNYLAEKYVYFFSFFFFP